MTSKTEQVYVRHGHEACPHGSGIKAFCSTCMTAAAEQEDAASLQAKVQTLEDRLAALEALVAEGGPGAGND